MSEREVVLRLENVVKVFPGVKALDNVRLDVRKGEVHALCGENGAGKSTLMKIISGAQGYTSGKMYFEEKEVKFSSTKEAQDMGISMIYQEFNLIPYLSIAENIFLGRQPMNKFGIIDWNKLNEEAKKLLERVGLNVNPTTLVKDISVAEAQMVEIVKCLSINSKVIIMDEPTAALLDEEIEKLFENIRKLTSEGIAVIYISHRMEEIFEITDRITVFRDGKYIKTMDTKDTNNDELVSLMVGKNIMDLYPKRNFNGEENILAVNNMRIKNVKDLSFDLKKGEILGIYGLLGSGTIELSKAIFGFYEDYKGEIYIEGKKVHIRKPLDAIENGISLVPDDRKNEGLILIRSIKENVSLASLDKIKNNSLLNDSKEKEMVDRQVKQLNIKISSPEQAVGNLSGGNQQKVVFAKMLETKPKVLILDEPTRGVDVGAKAEIYQIINQLTEDGISIILVSSDLPELIGMSDRILVMKEGKIQKELSRSEANQEIVLSYAAGGVN
ncbi:ATP-binding cassette domain-containing protein [Clostridium bovifaecis]|uniref:ATP-binding cassette domain-containing protein n=1 Tax=Clostridium bovifaecis TaxID=2184719 RepID=A0A6I6FA99_9CLOT|nr:ATP-binding cassette domain-containing protein [Clostridium bovifaecis]